MTTLDLGHKTIAIVGIVLVRDIRPEDLATAETDQPWRTVIRKLDNSGGYSLKPTNALVGELAAHGLQLTLLASGEAIAVQAIKSIAPFKSKPGAPNPFNTTVHFFGEANRRGTWLKAAYADVAAAFATARPTPAYSVTRVAVQTITSSAKPASQA